MSTTTTSYQIFNKNRELYCGPRFWLKDHEPGNDMQCDFKYLHQVGEGFSRLLAESYLRSLRKSYPRTTFEIHEVTITIKPLQQED